MQGSYNLSNAVRLIGKSGTKAGRAVSAAGDVNNDGIPDVLVGADIDDYGEHNTGTASLVLGPVSSDVDLHDPSAQLVGEEAHDGAGASIASAGDVNGDGFDDVLVGAPGEDSEGTDAAATYLLYGPLQGTLRLADADARFLGEDTGHEAGTAVSSAGDANGDGYDDFLIGAPDEDDKGTNSGAAYLILGKGL